MLGIILHKSIVYELSCTPPKKDLSQETLNFDLLRQYHDIKKKIGQGDMIDTMVLLDSNEYSKKIAHQTEQRNKMNHSKMHYVSNHVHMIEQQEQEQNKDDNECWVNVSYCPIVMNTSEIEEEEMKNESMIDSLFSYCFECYKQKYDKDIIAEFAAFMAYHFYYHSIVFIPAILTTPLHLQCAVHTQLIRFKETLDTITNKKKEKNGSPCMRTVTTKSRKEVESVGMKVYNESEEKDLIAMDLEELEQLWDCDDDNENHGTCSRLCLSLS